MKKLIFVLMFCMLAACGGGPDFFVGPTAVYLEEGAEKQIPCDFVAVLRETHRELENRYDLKTANKLMSTPVRLFPDYATPRSKLNYSLYLNGLKEGGEIQIRILGPSLLRTAYLHEQIDHCLCAEVHNDMNASHKNMDCALLEHEFSVIVREKTTKERENRCSDEYWRQ